jgi:NADH-quinone oxidoreductase subunit G
LLRVLGNVLNLEGFDYQTSEAVRDEVLGANAEFVSGLDNGISGVDISIPQASSGLQRIADVPINFADPMARRSVVLQQTADSVLPVVGINPVTLDQLGLVSSSKLKVKQGAGETTLDVLVDSRIPVGCVRVSAAHTSTAMLGEMYGQISVERA